LLPDKTDSARRLFLSGTVRSMSLACLLSSHRTGFAVQVRKRSDGFMSDTDLARMADEHARYRRAASACLAGAAAAWLASHASILAPGGAAALRAFAEAGIVGGVADWFAVTALFRRPLGAPIPHTALIPRNRDRIADGIATYIDAEFLVPAMLVEQLR